MIKFYENGMFKYKLDYDHPIQRIDAEDRTITDRKYPNWSKDFEATYNEIKRNAKPCPWNSPPPGLEHLSPGEHGKGDVGIFFSDLP